MGYAQTHKAKILAKEASAEKGAEGAETMEGATAYDLEMLRLTAHSQELSAIQSVEKKIARKAELLPEYEAYIDGVLEADSGVQDNVFMTLLVWAIDCHEFTQALEMARYGLDHDLAMPERFNRSLAATLTEEIADAVNKNDADIDLEQMEIVHDLIEGKDMHDQVRSKFAKALGTILLKQDRKPEALEAFKAALRLDGKAGVKTAINKLIKEIDQKPTN